MGCSAPLTALKFLWRLSQLGEMLLWACLPTLGLYCTLVQTGSAVGCQGIPIVIYIKCLLGLVCPALFW